MFGFKKGRSTKSGRTRRRDGWGLASSSQRRGIRKRSGLSARQQRKVVKKNRLYKKGKLF